MQRFMYLFYFSFLLSDLAISNQFNLNEAQELTQLKHSGGTDRNGCHHDRKRGGYHCH